MGEPERAQDRILSRSELRLASDQLREDRKGRYREEPAKKPERDRRDAVQVLNPLRERARADRRSVAGDLLCRQLVLERIGVGFTPAQKYAEVVVARAAVREPAPAERRGHLEGGGEAPSGRAFETPDLCGDSDHR